MFRKKKIIPFLCFVLMIFSSSMVSHASEISKGHEFYVNYAEPSTSDGQGYITLLLLNRSGSYEVATYFWHCAGNTNGYTSPVYAYLTLNPTSLVFNLSGSGSIGSAYYNLSEIWSDGTYRTLQHSGSDTYTVSLPSGYSVRGYKYAGNVGTFNEPAMMVQESFTVYYNSDNDAKLLRDLMVAVEQLKTQNQTLSDREYEETVRLYNQTASIVTRLTNIYNYVTVIANNSNSIKSYIEQYFPQITAKLDTLIEEQQESNTWLEKIFEFLEEKDEKDKQAATQQGSSSTSQGMDAIEDKGAGFADSLGGLTGSMSYTGTQCAWEFPEVKLPAISGVMDEVVLIRRQPIDFAQWVNAIPSDILLVVQSVCTIGLIVYCFKELYNTIAYVLTLRRDDNE